MYIHQKTLQLGDTRNQSKVFSGGSNNEKTLQVGNAEWPKCLMKAALRSDSFKMHSGNGSSKSRHFGTMRHLLRTCDFANHTCS